METDVEELVEFGANGEVNRVAVRGKSPRGSAAELFTVEHGVATWKTPFDSGSAAYDSQTVYIPVGGTWVDTAVWAEALYKAPRRTLAVLPDGSVRMERLIDIEIGDGPSARTITAWQIIGLSLEPTFILLNSDGTFFGIVDGSFAGTAGGLSLLPESHAIELRKIANAQAKASADQDLQIATRFRDDSPVAFTHVTLFDADNARFVQNQTVVTKEGKILNVGPAASVAVPGDARIIDGRGKTLAPGLWDAHMHIASNRHGVVLLSLGVTSGRNPAADTEATPIRNSKIANGELLSPTLYSSVLIDGKGPLTAQSGITVSSSDEAIETVRQVNELGFTGVKFYGSMKFEWLWPAVAEARRLNLHVHGHVPVTMRPSDAIDAGYHEITHINFVLMQMMPDSVVDSSNGMARILGPGRYGKDVDLASSQMKSFVAQMAVKKIVVDPTLSALEKVYVVEVGQLQPAFRSFVGTMPAATERSYRAGGFAVPAGATRADLRASFMRMLELTKMLHDAGVPIVAGTDGNGLELVRELELYVKAGLTQAQALQSATIVPARLVGADSQTGSIVIGKQADLVLVDGDPSQRIGDMRKTVWVMNDGVLMEADELRRIAGFVGRPR